MSICIGIAANRAFETELNFTDRGQMRRLKHCWIFYYSCRQIKENRFQITFVHIKWYLSIRYYSCIGIICMPL